MMHSTPNSQLSKNTRDSLAGRPAAPAARGLARNGFARGLLVAASAVALVLCPQGAFAQHGGGGGHAGGGGHFGGGGGHYSGSFGGSHGHATSGARSGFAGSVARPSSGPITVVHGSAPAGWHGAPPSSTPRPVGTGGFVAGGAPPTPQHVTIGFPPESGHGMVSAGGGVTTGAGADGRSPIVGTRGGEVLSFSGQGHEIWQNSPQSRSIEGQRPRPVGPHHFGGGFFGPGYGYGYGFGGFYPWGFGWGLGLGFGFDCDSLWNFGCGTYGYPGYGYYGPYEPGAYLYSGSGDDNGSVTDSSGDYGAYSNSPSPDAGSGSGAAGPNTAANTSAVIYLNDGTSFAVTDYWVSDYQLHYVVDGARENVIALDQIDVQRTVDENAARGVNFTLRPAPDSEQR